MKIKPNVVRNVGIVLFSALLVGSGVYAISRPSDSSKHTPMERTINSETSTSSYDPMNDSQKNSSSIDKVKKAQTTSENKSVIDKIQEIVQSPIRNIFDQVQTPNNEKLPDQVLKDDLLAFDTNASKADKVIALATQKEKQKDEKDTSTNIVTPIIPDKPSDILDPVQPEEPSNPIVVPPIVTPVEPVEPVDPIVPTEPPVIPIIPVDPIVTDYSSLEALVSEAEKINKENYLSESVSHFSNEMRVSKTMLESRTATQSEVDNQVLKLKQGIQNLVKRGDKKQLQALLAEIRSIDSEIYTVDSFSRLLIAKDKAEAIVSNADVTQEQVDNAEKVLRIAYERLEELNELQVSLVYLSRLVSICSDLKANDYTPESFSALTAVLDQAQQLLTLEDVEQSAVDMTLDQLRMAKEALVKRADKSELEDKIQELQLLNAGDYTADSWEIFATVMGQAQTVFSDENVDQTLVDQTISELLQAQSKLEIIPADPGENESEPIPNEPDIPENEPNISEEEAVEETTTGETTEESNQPAVSQEEDEENPSSLTEDPEPIVAEESDEVVEATS